MAVSSSLGAQSAEADRIRESTIVLNEIMNAADSGIPASALDRGTDCRLPRHGSRRVHRRCGTRAWHLEREGPRREHLVAARVSDDDGGSFGFQAGVRATDLVLVIQNRRGLENLVRNTFKIGAGAAATAGPVGRDAQAATDIRLRAEILSYSRSRGLFAGAGIDGSTIRQDRDANARFHGRPWTTREIVFDGKAAGRAPVAIWRDALNRHTEE
jgi:lipid-binding SYLF domain-containing protein